MQNMQEKPNLQKIKVNVKKGLWTEIKNGGHMPSSLGSRPIVVVRQADKFLQFF